MATQFNPQLVNWLKREMASDTDSIAIYAGEHYGDSLYREMVLTCLHAGLLEYQEHDSDVIYYTLTSDGSRELGRQEADSRDNSSLYTAIDRADGTWIIGKSNENLYLGRGAWTEYPSKAFGFSEDECRKEVATMNLAGKARGERPKTLEDHILYALEDGKQSTVQVYNHVLHIVGFELSRQTLVNKLEEMVINQQLVSEVAIDGSRMYSIPATPPAATENTEAGYVAIRDNVYQATNTDEDRHVGWFPEPMVSQIVAKTLNAETNALREQLAEARRERDKAQLDAKRWENNYYVKRDACAIAESEAQDAKAQAYDLQTELAAARERVAELDAQLQMLADDGVIEDVGLSRWKKIRITPKDATE